VDNGDFYFCTNYSISRVSNGEETLFAGHQTISEYLDGPLLEARFIVLFCLCLCRNGDILVGGDHMSVRKISNGMVSTLLKEKESGGEVKSIVEDWEGRYFFNTSYAIYILNQNEEPVAVIENISPSILAIDITGIYFTEQQNHVVKKMYYPVTWSPGNRFHLLTISELHFRFPTVTRESIRSIFLLCLKNNVGDPLYPKCLLVKLPKDILLLVVRMMNTDVFI
jgi:hypothetical protein